MADFKNINFRALETLYIYHKCNYVLKDTAAELGESTCFVSMQLKRLVDVNNVEFFKYAPSVKSVRINRKSISGLTTDGVRLLSMATQAASFIEDVEGAIVREKWS